MNKKILQLYKHYLFLFFTCLLISLFNGPVWAFLQAQQAVSKQYEMHFPFIERLITQNSPFGGTGKPPRVSGIQRDPCSKQIIALVPGDGKFDFSSRLCIRSSSDLALASDDKPIFWIYVPKQQQIGVLAKFQLFSMDGKPIGKPQNVQLSVASQKPTVISFRSTESLELNKEYQWRFSIHPIGEDKKIVGGLVKRVQQQSVSAKKIWHDKLAALSEKFCNKTSKSPLLDSYGLEALANVELTCQN